MHSDVAISVKKLSKTYRIFGHPGDRIKQALTFGQKQFHKEFTALKDVSFEIKKGETVGIIGRNGSGKSTLLQLICGILKPTSGTVEVNGRISALLELGAGFNPEFTGRENVYFQGALTGFSSEQMQLRFDDIAAFAGIGEFMDLPVRIYSSGMFVRLAFAVATSLEADVIVIDEAMAVGDVAFQTRCFDRIKQLKERGTTFLLVSHSTAQIIANVDRVLLLDQGEVVRVGTDVSNIVALYESRVRNVQPTSGSPIAWLPKTRRDIGEVRFGSFEATISSVCISQGGKQTTFLYANKSTDLLFEIDAKRAFSTAVLGASIRLPGGIDIWGDNNQLAGYPLSLKVGRNFVKFTFDLPLSDGKYLLYCGLAALDVGVGRVDLDQRWPIEEITVAAARQQVGIVYAPVKVSQE